MATGIDVNEKQDHPEGNLGVLERANSSYSDEKDVLKEDGVEVAPDDAGGIYEDVRVIDMGEDGKERPIGSLLTGSACFYLPDRDQQKRISTLRLDSFPSRMTLRFLVGLSACGSSVLVSLASVLCLDRSL
jgi:hypothetical protein